MIALCVTALVAGVLIGAVGIGGILLIPALNLMTTLSLQTSMATALSTFIFTGIVGTLLFQRRGSIDWSLTAPLCAGGAIFGFVGAWSSSLLDPRLLMQMLAAVILFAGAYTLLSRETRRGVVSTDRTFARGALLFGIGAVTGLGSGLTGVGGPALSVPIMVLFGFPTLSAIGAGQVIQIVAALSGTVGHLAQGNVDVPLAAALTVFEVIGVWFGVLIAHTVDVRHLRNVVGVLCIAVGIGLVVRSSATDSPALRTTPHVGVVERPPAPVPPRPGPASAAGEGRQRPGDQLRQLLHREVSERVIFVHQT